MTKQTNITKASKKSASKRAGITFSVRRIHKILKKGNFAPRIAFGASVFLAAVVEYLCAEVLELAGQVAMDNMKRRITPRHVLFAIQNDEELAKMTTGVTISKAGVMPIVFPKLKPKKTVESQEY